MKTARQKESGKVQTVGLENLEICTVREEVETKGKRHREAWSPIEKVDNTSILTAFLGRLSKLSFMNFYQIALERNMKALSVIVHGMKM